MECPDLKSLQTVSEDRQCLLNVEDYQIDISAEVEDIPFISLFKPDAYADSRESAAELFKLLIKPLSIEQFFRLDPDIIALACNHCSFLLCWM